MRERAGISGALSIASAFLRARRWFAIASPQALERHQHRLLDRLRAEVMGRSPYYREHARTDLAGIPQIDKREWMARFDSINTAGITLARALDHAAQAEQNRNFAARLDGLTVGLSTGTSGRRGVFLVSDRERYRWAGVMLAALLRGNLLARRRVAFFLRANSPLYETAGIGPVSFRHFDLLRPWRDLVREVADWQPDVLIAPAGVLALLAREARIRPRQIVSVAEVLDRDDRAAIGEAFGVGVEEVYQATEGVIALPCAAGRLHLNEAFMIVETHWLDRASRRFSPVVTDLTRSTQPVIRYRLDDIVTLAEMPCDCGMTGRTIERIEGRCDDICHLHGSGGETVPVFPDFLVRAFLVACPGIERFVFVQDRPGRFDIAVEAMPDARSREALGNRLGELAASLGGEAPEIRFTSGLPEQAKRRRVVRLALA